MGTDPDEDAPHSFISGATQKTKSALDQTDLQGQVTPFMLPLSGLNLGTNMLSVSKGQTSVSPQGNGKSLEPGTEVPRFDDPARLQEGERSSLALTNISSARLTEKLSQSEMRVDLRSEDFGQITVHSTLGKGSVSTQITLENTLLGSTLGTHVRELEQRLDRDHGLRASVSIDTQSGSRSPSDDPRGSEQESYPRSAWKNLPSAAVATKAAGTVSLNPTWRPSATPGSQRIDIRI